MYVGSGKVGSAPGHGPFMAKYVNFNGVKCIVGSLKINEPVSETTAHDVQNLLEKVSKVLKIVTPGKLMPMYFIGAPSLQEVIGICGEAKHHIMTVISIYDMFDADVQQQIKDGQDKWLQRYNIIYVDACDPAENWIEQYSSELKSPYTKYETPEGHATIATCN